MKLFEEQGVEFVVADWEDSDRDLKDNFRWKQCQFFVDEGIYAADDPAIADGSFVDIYFRRGQVFHIVAVHDDEVVAGFRVVLPLESSLPTLDHCELNERWAEGMRDAVEDSAEVSGICVFSDPVGGGFMVRALMKAAFHFLHRELGRDNLIGAVEVPFFDMIQGFLAIPAVDMSDVPTYYRGADRIPMYVDMVSFIWYDEDSEHYAYYMDGLDVEYDM